MKNLCVSLLLLGVAMCFGCSGEDVTGQDPPADEPIRVPQDQPNIQAAINVANPGDTIVVAHGRYAGLGNQDIRFGGKWVVLMSENGPAQTVISIAGDSADQHFAFELTQASESDVVIDGFTIVGAYSNQGSVLNLRSASPTIKNCIFVNNVAVTSGGAIRCKNASPTFINCTFYGNSAPTGAIIYLVAGSSPQFDRCILASSTGGDVVVCSDALCLPSFSCTDIYGNVGGDWLECISHFLDSAGNISLDPLFCNISERDFHLQPGSPCDAENSVCGDVIGALGGNCLE